MVGNRTTARGGKFDRRQLVNQDHQSGTSDSVRSITQAQAVAQLVRVTGEGPLIRSDGQAQ